MQRALVARKLLRPLRRGAGKRGEVIDLENNRRFLALTFTRGVEIPKWALLQILTALPSDAILFHADFDFRSNQCHLVFWSSELEEAPPGGIAPTVSAWIDTEKLHACLSEMPWLRAERRRG